MDSAIKMVKNDIINVNANMIDKQKQASKSGYSVDLINPDLKSAVEEANALLEDLTARNQKMFFMNMVIVHFADSKKQLDLDTKAIQDIGAGRLVNIQPLTWQQENGLNACLPLCTNKLEIWRTLTTEAAAVFMPFVNQGGHHLAVRIGNFPQKVILHLLGKGFQEQNTEVYGANHAVVGLEGERWRGNHILGRQPHPPHDVKAELLLVKDQLSIPVIVHAVSKQTHRIGIVDVVEQLQTSCRGEGCSNCAADSFEVPYNIPIQPIEQGQGLLVAGSFDGDGCVAVFDPQMVDFPDVFADGIVVLFPHGIPFIHFHFHQGVRFQFHHVHGLLDGHNLIYHSGVEGVVKIGVIPVDFILGLIFCRLIVDVFENIGFGEHTVCGFNDA